MFTKFVRLEPLDIISLTDAKNQLNIIDFDDDDTYIISLIQAASNICEQYTNRLFSKCTVTGEFTSNTTALYLPYSPISSVTSVQIGVEDVTYEFNDFSEILQITDTTIDQYSNIRVIYDAGYSTSTMPEMVKHAVKVIVSDIYNNRESSSDIKMDNVTFSALKLLDAYKTVVV